MLHPARLLLLLAVLVLVATPASLVSQEIEQVVLKPAYVLYFSETPDGTALPSTDYPTEAEAKAAVKLMDGLRGPDREKLYFNVHYEVVDVPKRVKVPETISVSEELKRLKERLITTYQQLRDIAINPSKLTLPGMDAINKQIDKYNSDLAEALQRNPPYFSDMRPLPRMPKPKQEVPKTPPKIEPPDVPTVDVKPIVQPPKTLNTNNSKWKAARLTEMELHPDGSVTKWRENRTGTYEVSDSFLKVWIPKFNDTSGGQGYRVIYKILSPTKLKCLSWTHTSDNHVDIMEYEVTKE